MDFNSIAGTGLAVDIDETLSWTIGFLIEEMLTV